MTMSAQTRVSCACGCGRKFVPTRYTHRYATRECYQMTYQKENPVVGYAKDRTRIRHRSVPTFSEWMTLPEASKAFGVAPTLLRERMKKILRKKGTEEGLFAVEAVSIFLHRPKQYANVIRRLLKFNVVFQCSCGKYLPNMDARSIVYCGGCSKKHDPSDTPGPENPIENIAEETPVVQKTEETPTHALASAAQSLHPLLRFLEGLHLRVTRLEARMQARLEEFEMKMQEAAKATDSDQLAAEVGYLKEAIRKATMLIEDQGIRSAAVDSRLARLEKDLGVTK